MLENVVYRHRFTTNAIPINPDLIETSEIVIDFTDNSLKSKDETGVVVTLGGSNSNQNADITQLVNQINQLQAQLEAERMRVEQLFQILEGTNAYFEATDTVLTELQTSTTPFVATVLYADVLQQGASGNPHAYAMKEFAHMLNTGNPSVEIWDGVGKNVITPIYLMDSNSMRINCNGMQPGEQWTVRVSR